MQFGFMPGRETTDAIFILRQLQEKYLVKSKNMFYAFVDLVIIAESEDKLKRKLIRWKN